jgi:hypothetical protein
MTFNRLPTIVAIVLSTALAGVHPGCRREAATAPAAKAATAPAAGTQVARIVFVDKERCCACTRQRIDDAWKALTGIVGFPPGIDVERIHLDTQKERAEPYQRQRAVMVPPAIYFFDRQGTLIDVLQGEVSKKQLQKVLGPV